MNYSERAAEFQCEGEWLIGVLAVPEREADTAIVVIVGGPQYRAGSHRQFVSLSRKLAAGGHTVLRFDYRGMGDSGGEARSFESVCDDIAAAIDAVMRSSAAITRVVLWGLCDGASAALMYMQHTNDRRVGGLSLLNPWVRSEAGFARTQVKHYYLKRLAQRSFWGKLMRGRIAKESLTDLGRSLRRSFLERPAAMGTLDTDTFQLRMLAGLQAFDGPILLVLSGNDLTAREFAEQASGDVAWRVVLAKRSCTLERHDVEHADHTLSDAQCREIAEDVTLAWLQRNFTGHPSSTPLKGFLDGVSI